MGTEVDSLEVKVEASAKSANAELDKLIAKIKEVKQGLSTVMGKDFSFDSTKSLEKDLDDIADKADSIGKKKVKIDVDDKKVKKAAKSYDELLEKYKNSKLMVDFKVNDLGVKELAKMQENISQKLKNTMQGINDTMERKGTSFISGDAWEKQIQKAQQYKNLLNEIRGVRSLSPISLSEPKTEQKISKIVPDKDKGIAEEAKEASKLSKILSGTQKVSKSLSNTFGKMGKTVSGVVSKAKDLKNLITRTNKSGGQMSMGRMLGMSLVFSTVFSALSAINNAIKEGSNNLVQYSSDYNKSISGIVTSLLYLKNAWAAAFAPIINVVGPYISAFIDMLANAMNKVAQFMAVLTGKTAVVQAKKAWKDYGKTLTSTGSSAKKAGSDAAKAAKDLKNYTLGIDELNVIQPTTSSSSGGSDGSSGAYTGPDVSEMFETTEPTKAISDFAQKLKDALAKSDFTEIGTIVGQKLSNALDNIPWDGIQESAKRIGKSIGTFITGFVEVPNLGFKIGSTIGEGINTGIDLANSFLDNTKWSSVGDFLGRGLNGLIDTVDWQGLGHMFAAKFNAFFDTFGEAARTFHWNDFGMDLADGLNQWITDFNWSENGAHLGDIAIGLLSGIKSFLETTDWQSLGNGIADFIGGIDWSGVADQLFEGIGAALGGILAFLRGLVEDAWKDVVKWWKDTAFEDGKFTMEGLLNGIWEKFKDIGTWIKEHVFQPFIDGFKSAFGIHSPSTVMAEQGGYIMDGLLNGVTDKLQPVLDFFGDMKDKIVEKFDDVKVWFGDKFGKAREAVEYNFSDIGTWFTSRKNDIQNGTKDIDTWMNTKYTNARKYVNSAFSDVGKWFSAKNTDIQNGMKSISSWFGTKFRSARSLTNAAFSNIGSWFGQKREDIKSNMKSIAQWFKDIFNSAYNGITSIFDKIGGYFNTVASWIKSPVLGAVKAIAKAVNWVYGKLGGDGDLINVSGLDNYASGTNGVARDSFGVVNDQPGNTYRELVQYPNGQTVIPTGRNVVLPMPKGTKVMPAGQTAALMGITGVKKYKSGIGNFFGSTADKISDIASNIFSYIKDPKKLLKAAIDKFTDLTGALEPGITIAKTAVNSLFETAVSKIKGFFDSFGAVNYKPSAGVEQWRGLAKQALLMTNQFSESNLNALLTQMMHESGGNPNAINNWDINAIRGIPSKGLMQVIDPTFRANAMAGFNTNIYDPLSNMIAAINYTVKRYGSLYAGWTARGYKGYANGIGTFKLSDVVGKYSVGGFPQNGELFVANEKAPEYVGRMGNRNVVANNNQIVTGVSNGVAEANKNTERLLQKLIEQNERLLRKNTSLMMNSKKVNKELSRGSRNSGYSFSTT